MSCSLNVFATNAWIMKGFIIEKEKKTKVSIKKEPTPFTGFLPNFF